VRKDAGLCCQALAEIGGRHALAVQSACIDEYGVNTVFHLPTGAVVKLFTASDTWEHEAAVMQCLHDQATGTAPRLLHTGSAAGLPYVVMSRLPGRALQHAWDELPRDAAIAVREQLGAVLRRVHACALPATTWPSVVRENLPAGVTPSWTAYIQTRRERAVDRQREKNCPAVWLQTMPAFLDEVGVHQNSPARVGLLHGEVNADHVFVTQEVGEWRVTGLLDFQAAMPGDPEHELAQAAFHCCVGEPACLRALLRGYGFANRELSRDLQRRFMAHFLLFAWCPFQRYIVKPEFSAGIPPGDFDALAGRWFDFGLVYKVSPPRKNLTFDPSVFYRTEDFKSSSTRPKPGYIRDTLLYAGDEREISIHMQTNRRSDVTFRPLTAAEEAAGYQIICDTVDWLRTKGIDLWRRPLPREVYAARQERGENFGLFVGGELAVIVSLVNGVPEYWAAEVKAVQPVWLCTLATATEFRRRDLGRQAVSEALRLLRGRVMYLDCKPGWLEEFYRSLGFVELEKKTFTLSHGPCGPIDAVLMRWMACPVSARLRFRPVTAQDVDNLLLIFGDPVAMEFWPATKTREEIVKSIERIRQGYREHGHGLWAVELKETGEFVGRVGLIHQEEGIEVGYALVPRHWHRGYATEAALACRDWAFEHLECDRMISFVHTRNLPSCRVAERNGMRVVTEITRANLPHHVYAITREEWENRP
jgi:RimJ/RimL family protein N-acetyltransferase/aminoglycoside phosphotransferase (APT) family kinase protein